MPYDLNIDFETRSACDLLKAGAYVYSKHPTTDVLCLYLRYSETETVRWIPGEPIPDIVYETLNAKHLMNAWNSAFERVIWDNVLINRYDFPTWDKSLERDTMARALLSGLPGKLDAAGPAAGLPQSMYKDDKGHRLMLQVSKPRQKKALGREPKAWHSNKQLAAVLDDINMGLLSLDEPIVTEDREYTVWDNDGTVEIVRWWNDPDRMQRLYDYCEQDTLAERAIMERLPVMPQVELDAWRLDRKINDRGFRVDLALIDACKEASDQGQTEAAEVLARLTDGEVTAVTKVQELKQWINSKLRIIDFPEIEGCGKDILEAILPKVEAAERELNALDAPVCRTLAEVIKIRLFEGKTSAKKLDSARASMDAKDHRVRGGLQFAGAGRTARWAGRLFQPHNIPRPAEWAHKDWQIKLLINAIEERDYLFLHVGYGGLGEVVSSLLRSIIVPAPGYELTAADFNAIEMRFQAWLAGCNNILKALRNGEDVYRQMAATVLGIKDWRSIPKDSWQRHLGKTIILGCGYQMGVDRFLDSCLKEGLIISRELAKKAVDTYRTANSEIKKAWASLNKAAIHAVKTGSKCYCLNRRICFFMRGKDLICVLPSGREQRFIRAHITTTQKFDKPMEQVKFYGFNGERRRMEWQTLYGGRIFEGICQAGSRDILRDALTRLDDRGFGIILTVHDEIISEDKIGTVTVKMMESIMAEPPNWAPDIPLKAEGWQGPRYRK